MATDCYFIRISGVHEHPNAEKLDIGYANNWQVVIPKDTWVNGELGLYICPDATLPDDKDWVTPYLGYLGRQNRVKIIKLRGEYSNGILLKFDEIKSYFDAFCPESIEELEPEVIAQVLGIKHYAPPMPNDLSIAFGGLPYNLNKTDEENWESLKDKDLHLGERALVTKKMDGCSATYIATPEGEFVCCGRRFTYKNECENRYTNVGLNQVYEPLIAYAKKHNKIIAVRGEITGQGIQSFGINQDSKGPLTFNLFNCTFPDEPDPKVRKGCWGQWSHFLEVNKELGLKTVPILGEVIITKELLKSYQNAPASEGEGVVLNFAEGSYKAKSAEYYSKIK